MSLKCTICFNQLVISENNIYSTPCGHVFHFVCITDWITRAAQCPLCRKPSTLQDLHEIFLNINTEDDGATCNILNSKVLSELATGVQIEELKSMIESVSISFTAFEVNKISQSIATNELKEQIEGMQSEINDQNRQIAELKEKLQVFQNENEVFRQQNIELNEAISKQTGQIQNFDHKVNDPTVISGHDDRDQTILNLMAENKKLVEKIKENDNTMTIVFDDLSGKKNMKPKMRV